MLSDGMDSLPVDTKHTVVYTCGPGLDTMNPAYHTRFVSS